jgi:hypothetical protein
MPGFIIYYPPCKRNDCENCSHVSCRSNKGFKEYNERPWRDWRCTKPSITVQEKILRGE